MHHGIYRTTFEYHGKMVTIKFLIMVFYYHGFTIRANTLKTHLNTSDISAAELLSNGDAYYIETQKDRIH